MGLVMEFYFLQFMGRKADLVEIIILIFPPGFWCLKICKILIQKRKFARKTVVNKIRDSLVENSVVTPQQMYSL